MTDREKAERQAFLDAIKDDPYDQATRLVFSDWLEEHGLDDEARVQREWTRERYDVAWEFMGRFTAEELSEAPFTDDESGEVFGSDHAVSVDELLEVAGWVLDGKKTTYQWGDKVIEQPAELCLPFDPDWEEIETYERYFWEHYEVITGRPVSRAMRGKTFIRCAC